MITVIPSHDARAVWPLAEPILSRATDRTGGRFTTADALDHIEQSTMQLWLSWPLKAVAVTEVVAYRRDKACRFVLTAGDIDTIFAGLPVAERWAREAEGCSFMELRGRRGWERALAPYGYTFDSVSMQKVL